MLGGLITAVSEFKDDLPNIIRESLVDHEDDLLNEQKEQLFEGKASSGDYLRPFYSEDMQASGGYFKDDMGAMKYREWKEKLTYPTRVVRQNTDAPNLYINGKFHDEIGIDFGSEQMEFVARTSYAGKIMDKYGRGNFGLTDERMREVVQVDVVDDLIKALKERI